MKSTLSKKKTDFLIKHFIDIFQNLYSISKPSDLLLSRYFSEHKYLGSSDRRNLSQAIFQLLREELSFKTVIRLLPDFKARNTVKTAHAIVYLFARKEKLFEAGPEAWLEHLKLKPAVCSELWQAYKDFQAEQLAGGTATQLGFKYAMPEWMVEALLKDFKADQLETLFYALNQPAPVVLRANELKVSAKKLRAMLEQEGIPTTYGRLSPHALICDDRPRVFQTNAFKEGLCEVQDEGSQVISLLLNPKPKEKILDACAGGGGKTLHLGTLMNGKGNVYAYEVNMKRFGNISERTKRSGLQNVQLLKNPERLAKATDFTKGGYDAILIDAPCSGSGTLRRNPDIKKRLTPESVKRLHDQQTEILRTYGTMLKPGGRLVYATCSLLREENQDSVECFVKAHPEFKIMPICKDIQLNPNPFLTEGLRKRLADSRYLQLRPDTDNTDGFFAALLIKVKP